MNTSPHQAINQGDHSNGAVSSLECPSKLLMVHGIERRAEIQEYGASDQPSLQCQMDQGDVREC